MGRRATVGQNSLHQSAGNQCIARHGARHACGERRQHAADGCAPRTPFAAEPLLGRPIAARGWQRARRAAWLILLVVALGVLLYVTGVLHMADLLLRAGTVGSRVPNPATATARVLALYPYAAPAPGPGCDHGAAVWVLMDETSAQSVVCAPTFTQLIAPPSGASVGMSLRGAPLPARYTISLSVANITPCASAIVHVATATQSWFDLRLNGPAEATCSGTGYFLETTYPSGAGAGWSNPYPVKTSSHTIVIHVDGTQVQLALDGVLLNSFTDVAPPPVWDVVQLSVSQLGGSGPTFADFSNFKIA
jgi:hypothetical protein